MHLLTVSTHSYIKKKSTKPFEQQYSKSMLVKLIHKSTNSELPTTTMANSGSSSFTNTMFLGLGLGTLIGFGVYSQYSAAVDSHANAKRVALMADRNAGKKEVLEKLVRLGPGQIEQMCAENGVRFSTSVGGASGRATRLIREELSADIRKELRVDLEGLLKPEIHQEVWRELKVKCRELILESEYAGIIAAEVRAEYKAEQKRLCGSALRAQVREELSSEYLRELSRYWITSEDGPIEEELKRECFNAQSQREDLRKHLFEEMRSELRMEIRDSAERRAWRDEMLRESKVALVQFMGLIVATRSWWWLFFG